MARLKSARGVLILLGALCLCVAIACISWGAYSERPPASKSLAAPAFRQPETLAELLAVPVADLGKVDIARMNLLCAEGLPGSEDLDVARCLATLDEWARRIRWETARDRHQFERHPAKYAHSEARFQVTILMCALGQSFGVGYDNAHPAEEPAESFFARSDVMSLHHLLGPERAGTCASMPVLVVALGRRLGYPLKLVNARIHGYARWDDGQEVFNIEATNTGGLAINPDGHYRKYLKDAPPEIVLAEGYLASATPRQELAQMLASRACCLEVNGRFGEVRKLSRKCLELIPGSKRFRDNS